jgi:hypothetical protein
VFYYLKPRSIIDYRAPALYAKPLLYIE